MISTLPNNRGKTAERRRRMQKATPIPAIPSLPYHGKELEKISDDVDVQPVVEPEEEALVQPIVADDVEATATCASALSELDDVDRLLITRKLSVKGVMILQGKKNRFYVRTPDQNLLYTVEEHNRWWVGYLCYGLRPMHLNVTNRLGVEVMTIVRPYAFTTRILPCQLQRLQIFSPPGELIGNVAQQWTALKPIYCITDKDGKEVFWIHGPRITMSCYTDIQFHVQRPNGSVVGSTCKRWEGLMHALFFAPVIDRFGIAFEKDLTQVEKALLLATSLLFDYMYYDM